MSLVHSDACRWEDLDNQGNRGANLARLFRVIELIGFHRDRSRFDNDGELVWTMRPPR
jgi:hypothetical protein